MLQGSLVILYRRCGKKNCRCYRENKKHGPAYYLSVPEKATEMYYLEKEAATSQKFKQSLLAFKRYWKLGRQIAKLNLALYKMSFTRRK
jgi:hypothetical protein